MNTATNLYPESPRNVPADLTAAKPGYRRQAWLAMAGLVAFLLIYITLLCGFGYVTYRNLVGVMNGHLDVFYLILVFCSGLLTVFWL